MNKAVLFNFTVDRENRKIQVVREFNAPLKLVWAAWTDPEILSSWWAPKPWRAEIKSLNFTEGGRWHYYMAGPNGERQWCLFDYEKIVPEQRYTGKDSFCDENEVMNDEKPKCFWDNKFIAQADKTLVKIDILFDNAAGLDTILEMGFREGFSMGLENLDEYLRMVLPEKLK